MDVGTCSIILKKKRQGTLQAPKLPFPTCIHEADCIVAVAQSAAATKKSRNSPGRGPAEDAHEHKGFVNGVLCGTKRNGQH